MPNITYLSAGTGTSFWVGDREFVTVKRAGDDTDDAFALLDLIALPGAEPPPHIHNSADELYCLLEGELDVLDGDRIFTAREGSVFHIPKGTLHAWRNASAAPARSLLFISPAGFEGLLYEVGTPATDLSSPPPPPALPTPEDARRLLELGRKYDTEYPEVPAW